MEFAERLKFVLNNESVNSFARKTRIGEATLRQYLKGANPGLDKVVMIAEATGISVEWLATGKGQCPDIKQNNDGSYVQAESVRAVARDRNHTQNTYVPSLPAGIQGQSKTTHMIDIPVMNMPASAGGGAVVPDEGVASYIGFDAAWLRTQWNLIPNELFTLPTMGESMEPTVKAGEFLLCSASEHHRKPGDGIYVIRLDGNILVKRLQPIPGGKLLITSDNPIYKPYEISLNDGVDFLILGKVMLVHGLRRV